MLDQNVQSIITDCLQEMQDWDWDDEDMFWAACAAVLKYAEARGLEASQELIAAIQAAVKQQMKGEES